MIVAAAMTTIYAMVLTLLLTTPERRQLFLGLDDLRQMHLCRPGAG